MYLCSITLDPFLKIFGLTSQLRFIFFTNIDRYFSACQYFFFFTKFSQGKTREMFLFSRIYTLQQCKKSETSTTHFNLYA